MSEVRSDENLLGIDYGSANIGVAFGKAGLVEPLHIISGKHTDTALAELLKLISEHKISKIVFGLPLNEEGKETSVAREIRRFAKLLKIRSKKEILFIDEYNSTKEGITEAINTGISKKRRKFADHISAAVILKKFYHENLE